LGQNPTHHSIKVQPIGYHPINGGEALRDMGNQQVMRVIIDTDPGVDDALALLFALKSPELRIEAVTTVAGNVGVDQCYQNVFRIFDLLRLPDKDRPPVFMGASEPLDREGISSEEIHGRDGLGDYLPKATYPSPVKYAPDAIIAWAEKYPGEMCLITLGPLTNLALAIQKKKASLNNLRAVIIMAGAFTVPGNITPRAEYNMYVDPLAAQIVLQAGLSTPVTMVGLDVTREVILTQEEVNARAKEEGEGSLAQKIRYITHNYMAFHQKAHGFNGCYLHDPLAIGIVCDPSLVQKKSFFLDVDTGFGEDRGMIKFLAGKEGINKGIEACLQVEVQRFLNLFLRRVYEPSLSRR
jgi:pyrimidine-specific ribonucleoside hydrolase